MWNENRLNHDALKEKKPLGDIQVFNVEGRKAPEGKAAGLAGGLGVFREAGAEALAMTSPQVPGLVREARRNDTEWAWM